jgi:BlaI family transcriptional regulator, penicillinase repressor
MVRRSTGKPTEAELAILHVLWERGPCAVRDVHDALQQSNSTSYTTTLKLMQLMHGKGLVQRDERARAHVYQATLARESIEKLMVGDLISRLFGGSPSKLVLQALGSGAPASRSELDGIKAMLAELEAGLDDAELGSASTGASR